MTNKLWAYLLDSVFVAGWRGSVTIHVADGVPLKIEKHEHKQVDSL